MALPLMVTAVTPFVQLEEAEMLLDGAADVTVIKTELEFDVQFPLPLPVAPIITL